MPWTDAFLPAEARDREAVLQSTWGHLAPTRHKTYRGHITFAIGCMGSDDLNPTVLELELGSIDGSPWFTGAMDNFLSYCNSTNNPENMKRYGWRDQFGEKGMRSVFPWGGVYRFDGTFRNYRFKGKMSQVLVPSRGAKLKPFDVDWTHEGEEEDE